MTKFKRGMILGLLFLGSAASRVAYSAGPAYQCTLDNPIALIKKSDPRVKQHSFKVVRPQEGEEKVVLSSGDTLLIKAGGCDNEELSVRYESRILSDSSGNSQAAYLGAVKALRLLSTLKSESGFDFEMAARRLEKVAKQKNPTLGKPVEFDPNNELHPSITVKTLQTQAGAGIVEFSLIQGPM